MDYYAQWPSWKMPKWLGATLGGIFTLIVILCAGLCVQLTRPPRKATAPAVTTRVATPAAAVAVAPAPKTEPPIAAVAPPTTATEPNAPAKKTHEASHTHRRSLMAKHDGKSGHVTKSDIDRLLGL